MPASTTPSSGLELSSSTPKAPPPKPPALDLSRRSATAATSGNIQKIRKSRPQKRAPTPRAPTLPCARVRVPPELLLSRTNPCPAPPP